MKVSLVTPVYNEENNLHRFLTMLNSLELPCDKELVFVDDGSKDNSFAIIQNFPFTCKTIILSNGTNKGKGAALRLGLMRATGDIIGIQDADFEYDMRDITKLLVPLLDNKADVVFGSRFVKGNFHVHRTFHYLVNRLLTLLSNILSGLYLTDMETCYKFFKAEIIQNITLSSDRFGFEPEVTAKIARLKLRVFEIPISYCARSYLEGKKITWKDGVAALWHIFYFNTLQSKRKFFLPQMNQHYVPLDANIL